MHQLKKSFGFKDLEIWQLAVSFADNAISLTESLNSPFNHFRLVDQLESASASVSLNIAEGKGRNSDKEFIRFLYIARGSLYETITLADIFHKGSWITEEQLDELQHEAFIIASKIKGLINYLSKSEVG